ncbi:CBS-domain-containing protein [Basidiobolus meristosporus CBS 931.73]|uniref:CBS-domain-containing protein n=1 Tax=Basidiobolus meristosporus CBS 931.73 TaxID=1314790 RepID=A0A1Y1X741_9FUNG|nr:CBS-domain-containing protein [Basidiobolus meristosporus CBS 931.73]|eukprot:ORX81580.1 CBS-domain-containing protein [Basidiobolus meristosporus CBS 931.73]
MASHRIVSLPIYSHSNPKKIVNIVNSMDILSYIVTITKTPSGEVATTLDTDKLAKLDENIEVVMTLDNERESYRIVETETTDSLKKVLSAFSSGTHRALVYDYINNSPPFIITQSDIIKYLIANPKAGGKVDINKSISELGLIRDRELLSAKDTDSALQTYHSMSESNYSAVPVVDSDGKLVTALSAADLRGLNPKAFNNLTKAIPEFLKETDHGRTPLKTCTKQAPLSEIFQKIIDAHTHRVWVVENDKAIEVITLSDIIKLFV